MKSLGTAGEAPCSAGGARGPGRPHTAAVRMAGIGCPVARSWSCAAMRRSSSSSRSARSAASGPRRRDDAAAIELSLDEVEVVSRGRSSSASRSSRSSSYGARPRTWGRCRRSSTAITAWRRSASRSSNGRSRRSPGGREADTPGRDAARRRAGDGSRLLRSAEARPRRCRGRRAGGSSVAEAHRPRRGRRSSRGSAPAVAEGGIGRGDGRRSSRGRGGEPEVDRARGRAAQVETGGRADRRGGRSRGGAEPIAEPEADRSER